MAENGGPRTGIISMGGDRMLGYGGQDPRCQGLCRGSERNRTHSPAKYGHTPDGEKVIYCPCCEHKLRPAKPGESGLPSGVTVSMPSLPPDVAARARMFIDDICRYNVLSMKAIVAVGDASATAPEEG